MSMIDLCSVSSNRLLSLIQGTGRCVTGKVAVESVARVATVDSNI